MENLQAYLKEIESFLKDYLSNSGCKAYILGLSGGVDSSLVAALVKEAVGKDKLFCYAIDIESNPADIEDAKRVAKQLDVNLEVISLTETYHSYLKELHGKDFLRLSKSNLKVRMRMCALFAYAQEHSGLVLGTDNWDERYVGYFTKYGDGAADLLPIVHLTKQEVRDASKLFGLSEDLYNRVPTAGLFEGQTDEKEMGVLYKDLDSYLQGKEVSKDVKERIEHLHRISEHKRVEIPTPKPPKR